MTEPGHPVKLTDRQYREVVAYCSGVVEVDTAGDGEQRDDPASVMAVLLRHLRNMLVDPVGAQSLRHEVQIARDSDGNILGFKYLSSGE